MPVALRPGRSRRAAARSAIAASITYRCCETRVSKFAFIGSAFCAIRMQNRTRIGRGAPRCVTDVSPVAAALAAALTAQLAATVPGVTRN